MAISACQVTGCFAKQSNCEHHEVRYS